MRRGSVWQVTLARKLPKDAELIPVDLDAAECDASDLISAISSDVTDSIWQLELSGYAYMEARLDILAARTLADSVEATTKNALAVALEPVMRPRTALCVAKRFLRQPNSRWRSILLQVTALPLAMCTLIVIVLRYGGSAPRDLIASKGRPLLALHAENASRTRHLTQIAAQAAPDRHSVLLLGRPRHNLLSGMKALDPAGRLQHLDPVRPLDITGVLRSVLRGPRHMVRGLQAIAESGLDLPLRAHMAMLYRFAQGEAHADWWRRHARLQASPAQALFGHTGTADTTLLECEMQRSGTRTVHVCHGTNLGWPFAALSDLGLFQSRHDARLAASLPGYGQTLALASPRPKIRSGDNSWALLTSYTHPLNPAYTHEGAGADIRVINWLAQAARVRGQSPDQIFWRPHPMIANVRTSESQRLEAAIAEAGFARWPDDLDYAELGRFGAMVTTPSTALTDGLKLGAVPVLAVAAPLQSDLVYASHPLIAVDLETLLQALSTLRGQKDRILAFERAWEAIGPSSDMSMIDLVNNCS